LPSNSYKYQKSPSLAYPVVRLPRQFKAIAGENACIYQTEHDGGLAFVVIVEGSVGKFCANATSNNVEARISALESEISELKSALFLIEGCSIHDTPKTDGLEAIRTPDLRRVNTRV
jgi:hypothetical protein